MSGLSFLFLATPVMMGADPKPPAIDAALPKKIETATFAMG